MTRSHFIKILMILTKYVLDLGVRLTEFSVTVESVTLRFYCIYVIVMPWLRGIIVDNCPDSRGRSPSERAVSVR